MADKIKKAFEEVADYIGEKFSKRSLGWDAEVWRAGRIIRHHIDILELEEEKGR